MWNRLLQSVLSGVLGALWALIKLALISGTIALGSCTGARTILKTAPDRLPDSYMAPLPSVLTSDVAKPALETEIYGQVIAPTDVSVLAKTVTEDSVLDGRATLIQWQVEAGYGGATRRLDIALLQPVASPNGPVILSQNFCPNDEVIPLDGVLSPGSSGMCGSVGPLTPIFTFFFGRHIVTPPLEDILDAGYGFAAIYPSQFVPDSAEAGDRVLDTLFDGAPDRPGALAVWAGLADMTAELIEADTGERSFIVFGHSRFGKTALLSAAWFDRIDAAIAHQSGTLGASSMTDADGEPLADLVRAYPHWGNRTLRAYANSPASLPVRPRDLLAAAGAKPVLLGNAKRDVWSDPFGAFSEAQAAWGGSFGAVSPGDFNANADKAFWQRPGTHGVNKEDWEAFLAWLYKRDL